MPTVIEALLVSKEVCSEKTSKATFKHFHDMISVFRDIWESEKIILLGDFNLDQTLQENINRLISLKEIFNLQERSRYSTCQLRGILDLVLSSAIIKSAPWAPSPYSD